MVLIFGRLSTVGSVDAVSISNGTSTNARESLSDKVENESLLPDIADVNESSSLQQSPLPSMSLWKAVSSGMMNFLMAVEHISSVWIICSMDPLLRLLTASIRLLDWLFDIMMRDCLIG